VVGAGFRHPGGAEIAGDPATSDRFQRFALQQSSPMSWPWLPRPRAPRTDPRPVRRDCGGARPRSDFRGAQFALFIRRWFGGARADAAERPQALGAPACGRASFRCRDATRLARASPVEPFSLAFLDPTYRHGPRERALASLRAGGWLTRDARRRFRGGRGDAGSRCRRVFAEVERGR